MLKLRDGPTVADAANVFDVSFKRPGLLECGCNMHSRRYFVKALDAGDLKLPRFGGRVRGCDSGSYSVSTFVLDG